MSSSTEVEAVNSSTDVALSEKDLDALASSITAGIDRSDIALPLVNLAQSISGAVKEGIAVPGEWVNSVTEENYGDSFEFVIAGFFYGKQYRNNDKNFFGATAGDVIPDYWPHDDAGKLFDESDDYEPRFKELVNAGEREWGSGPPLATTYNFVGYRPGDHEIPLRISFAKTSAKTAKKLLTLFATDRRPWDHVYKIKSIEERGGKGDYYVASISRGDKTDKADIPALVDLAVNLDRATPADLNLEGENDEGRSAPKAKPKAAEGGIGL